MVLREFKVKVEEITREVGGRRSEVRSQRSEVGGRKSEVGSQKSEIRNLQSVMITNKRTIYGWFVIPNENNEPEYRHKILELTI
jgi:hypothetical protein